MAPKSLLGLSILLAITFLPSLAFGYGEGYRDDLPHVARQQVLLLNEARADPVAALKDCSRCPEKEYCHTKPLNPLYWDDRLFKSAQLHTNMLNYLAYEQDKEIYAHWHDSPCTVVSDIADAFPDNCDGQASCACTEKNYSSIKVTSSTSSGITYYSIIGTGTGAPARIKLFIPNATHAGQCLMSGTYFTPEPTSQRFREDLGFSYFMSLLYEPSDLLKPEPNRCKYQSSDSKYNNGHRLAMLSYGELNYHNIAGGGYTRTLLKSLSTQTNPPVYSITVQNMAEDLGKLSTIPDDMKNALTSGTHYKKLTRVPKGTFLLNGPMWFKAHYYSDTDVKKVVLRIGDQCVSLKQTSGLDKKMPSLEPPELMQISHGVPSTSLNLLM